MLMEGWEACCRRLEAGGIHPVIIAAIAGYGFVFLHPFEDGNSRLHRFLIQHALSAGGFAPQGILFRELGDAEKKRMESIAVAAIRKLDTA